MMGVIFYNVTLTAFRKDTITKILDSETVDYPIVALLAKKIKIKKLPNRRALSLNVIENRKTHIKKVPFNDNGGNKEIVVAAKKIGIL